MMPYGANASNPEATRTLVGEAKGPGPEISRSEAVGFLLGNRPAPSNKSLSGRSYASTDDALQWPAFERRVSIPVARSGLKVVCSNSSKPRAANTAISASRISTAKHGQSPQDPNLLRRIDDGAIVTAINSAWDKQIGCASNCTPLIVAGTDDDLWQSYLSVKTQGAADFVKAYLWTHSAPRVTYNGTVVSVQAATEPYPSPPERRRPPPELLLPAARFGFQRSLPRYKALQARSQQSQTALGFVSDKEE